MKQHLWVILFALALAAGKADAFVVFDGISGFNDKPDYSLDWKIENMQVPGANRLWGRGSKEDKRAKRWPPRQLGPAEEKRIRSVARRWKAEKLERVVLDIEHWRLEKSKDREEKNMDRFIKTITWVREEAPDLKVGIYAMVPQQGKNRILKKVSSRAHQYWLSENRRVARLAEHLDFICPVLYAQPKHMGRFETFARRLLAEASCYNKPVYPFVWPHYSLDEKDEKGRRKLGTHGPDHWKQMIEICKKYADGVIVWNWGRRQPWDPEFSWWKQVLEVAGPRNAKP